MRKQIVNALAVTVLLVAILLLGSYLINRHYDSPSRTSIAYTEDDHQSTFTASYPLEKSASIISYVKTWSQTNSVLKQNNDTVDVTFLDGRSYKVYTKGRKLLITADRSANTSASIGKFKTDFKLINDYILMQVKDVQNQSLTK